MLVHNTLESSNHLGCGAVSAGLGIFFECNSVHSSSLGGNAVNSRISGLSLVQQGNSKTVSAEG
jgi:hypothetical protein